MLYHPRNKLDLNGAVILRAIGYTLLPPDLLARKKLEALWSPRAYSKAFFSVRTGFDLLLRSLTGIEPGDEVIITAITIPAMWQIIEKRGLKVVAIDINQQQLAPSIDDFLSLVTHRTKILVITHVFGTANMNDAIIRAAKDRGIYVIEDCAQCYDGTEYHGNPLSDVSMFSFGPLKTASTLAGAIFHFSGNGRNDKTVTAMLKKERRYPKKSSLWLSERAGDYLIKIILQKKYCYYLLNTALRLLHKDIDELVVGSTRAFKGDNLLTQIRVRPPNALYSLMYWRFRTYSSATIKNKVLRSRDYRDESLNKDILCGSEADFQTAWLQPFLSDKPKRTVKRLRKIGIDGSLVATALSCYPHGRAPNAQSIIGSSVYAPLQHQIGSKRRREAAKILGIILSEKQSVADWPQLDRYAVVSVKPRNDAEIKKIIENSMKERATIRVIGRGKNSGQNLGSSTRKTYSISLDYYKHIEIDSAKQRIIVGAGTTWRELHKKLATKGLAPLVQQSADDFTIGGSLSSGIHGRDVHASKIIDSVVWIEAFDATGKLRRHIAGSDAVKKIVGGLGAEYLIVRASLQVVPNAVYRTRVRSMNYQKFFKMLTSGKVTRECDLMIVRPTLAPQKKFRTVLLVQWSKSSSETMRTQSFASERSSVVHKVIFRLSARFAMWATLRSALEETLQKSQNNKLVSRIDLMRPPLVPLAVLDHNHTQYFDHPQEFFIPLSKAEKFYEYIIGELGGKVVTGYTLRYVVRSSTYDPRGTEDQLAFMLYFTTKRTDSQEQIIRKQINRVARKALQLGGKPYLAYARLLDTDVINDAYPELGSVSTQSVFASDLLARITSSKQE
jgi:perosamine synthetase